MKRGLLFAVPWCLATVAGADEVLLKNGGRVSGVVLEQTARTVVVDIGAGLVSLPMSTVKQVKGGQAQIATYREREARLGPDDIQGWLELATWAQDAALRTQAREAYQHVLRVAPDNAAAHMALGDVFLGGRWLSAEESYRAQGLVNFEGAWVSPQQLDAMLAQRAAEDAMRQRREEDAARLREIEARANLAQAEAEARRNQGSSTPDGIPIYGGNGGGPCVVDSPYCVNHTRPRPHVSTPPPPPPPAVKPASDTGSHSSSKPPVSQHAGVGRLRPAPATARDSRE